MGVTRHARCVVFVSACYLADSLLAAGGDLRLADPSRQCGLLLENSERIRYPHRRRSSAGECAKTNMVAVMKPTHSEFASLIF